MHCSWNVACQVQTNQPGEILARKKVRTENVPLVHKYLIWASLFECRSSL